MICLLPGDDSTFLVSCQRMFSRRNIPMTLNPATTIDTLLRGLTLPNTEHLMLVRRLAVVDLLTRFYLPYIYNTPGPLSPWRDTHTPSMATNVPSQTADITRYVPFYLGTVPYTQATVENRGEFKPGTCWGTNCSASCPQYSFINCTYA